MRVKSLSLLAGISIAISAMILCSHPVLGQASCLTEAEVKRMLAQINGPQPASLDNMMRKKLLKIKENDQKRFQTTVQQGKASEVLLAEMKASREKNTLLLCPLLKEFGWPTRALVGDDGAAAAFLLLKNSSSFALQRSLLPVVIAATRKGEIEKSSFAGYLDNLRLRSGLKQLFGTQTTIMDGFLVLFPIANESLVDDRRKQFDLPPLADYLRLLEYRYNLPLIRAPGKLANKFVEDSQNPIAKATTLFEGEELEENEVVRISSDLVSINVSVYDQRLRTHVGRLTREDFTVLEDGQPQTISFFASTDVPFDLVLLIDLSGSTVGKRDLIRKSTRRFVEAARPSDRVAIVTFWDTTDVISPLTANHQELLEKIANIKGTGGSHVWDALKFTLDQVLGPKSLERRRAIVFMTDGVDNAFMGYQPGGSVGSAITFSQLLDAVRRTDVLVIPIYLDTESDGGPPWQRWYANARKTLGLLAEESGAPFYQARKIEDLDGVYTQVLNDLGQVYSLGYKPTNTKHDGLWRSVAIKVANHPELTTRSRPGYDAK